MSPAPVGARPYTASPALRARLVRHEGLRLKPYRDTAGKLTVGVGRNLDDVGIGEAEAFALLDADVARAAAGLDARLPWWRGLDPVRAEVLIEMAFNMGLATLCGFAVALAALREGRFAEAADAMLNSAWAAQVKGRATELADLVRRGVGPAETATGSGR